MNTPKERFLVSGRAAEFKKLVAAESFDVACDYAMIQLLDEMAPNILPGKPADPYIGLDANSQMQGATRFVQILKTLADPIEQPEKSKRDTLHY